MPLSNFVFIRKPFPGEAESIYKLVHHYALEGLILERSVSEIDSMLNSFIIAEYDYETIGCISSFDYGQGLIELRTLAVHSDFKTQGLGSRLVKAMINEISQTSKSRIFALSYSPIFFKKNGFIEIPKGMLPEKIWKDCLNCPSRDKCGETALLYSTSKIIEKPLK